MMPEKKKKNIDASAENKIKEAARKLFTQKGYAAVKTRDIATEAGINLALLNYYFRSKEKLFEIVMLENMSAFKKGIADLFSDESIDVFEKIEKLTTYYIDTFLQNPGLPLFIVNEISGGQHEIFSNESNEGIVKSREFFIKQFQQLANEGKIQAMHPMHFMANLMGLVIMPFLAKPMIAKRFGVDDQKFEELMNERKNLVPVWLKATLLKS